MKQYSSTTKQYSRSISCRKKTNKKDWVLEFKDILPDCKNQRTEIKQHLGKEYLLSQKVAIQSMEVFKMECKLYTSE
jgi:hypothetical protein